VNENRNMILAIVLSALVLIGWTMLADRFLPTAAEQPARHTETGEAGQAPQPQAGPVEQTPQRLRPAQEVLAESPRVQIRTPRLRGSISVMGARIDDLVLLRERQEISRESPPVRLLSPAGTPNSYFASFGWTGEGVQVPGPDAQWTASAPVLEPGQPVILSWSNDGGQTFLMTIGVDDNYLFTVDQRVENRGSGAVAVRPYGLINRADESPDPDYWTVHVGPISFLGGAANYKIDWDTLDGGRVERFDSRGGWLGFTDKYWLTALAPAGNAQISASFTGTPSGGYQADYAEGPQIVPPGGVVSSETRLFAGAKEKALLDRYEEAGNPKAVEGDRLGLVRMVHAAAVRRLELAVRADRKFRGGDHLPDDHRPADHVPDRPKAVQVVRGDAQGSAEAQGAPGEVQGRQAEAAAGRC
jgi:YidC/Oxa1 family membrane protein insertase